MQTLKFKIDGTLQIVQDKLSIPLKLHMQNGKDSQQKGNCDRTGVDTVGSNSEKHGWNHIGWTLLHPISTA